MSTIKVNRIENTSTASGGIDIDASGHVQFDGLQLPTAGSLSNRNLIINGAMRVAQRGTSASTNGYQTIDRFENGVGGGLAVTQQQVSLTSGAAYDEGFRKSFKGTVTTAANNTNTYWEFFTQLEGQDINSSGWNYKSSSSFVTLSYWVKTSAAGTYYNMIILPDMSSGNRIYRWSVTTEAGVWKKITHTIPGDSNLIIDDNNGSGFILYWVPHYGTVNTGSTADLNQWDSIDSADYTPDFAQNWANISGFTFEVTGIQLEAGAKNTPFEHRSYGDELVRCQRYFCSLRWSLCNPIFGINYRLISPAPVMEMRASPSLAYFVPSTGAGNGTIEHSTNTVRSLNSVNPANGPAGSSTYFGLSSNAVYANSVNVNFDAEL